MDYRTMIRIFHLVAVAPLFTYIGYRGKETEANVFNLLIIIAIFVIAYHAYRYYNTGWWINLMHIFIGLALIGLGYIGSGLPAMAYYLYFALAAVVAGWHIMLLFRRKFFQQTFAALQETS